MSKTGLVVNRDKPRNLAIGLRFLSWDFFYGIIMTQGQGYHTNWTTSYSH